VRTACGSYGHADFIPDDDDAAVERVKAADAIVIGKTQVPDFGYSGTGQTPLSVSASPERRCSRATRALLAGEGAC
jgi:aspartyl-tRNA(Asn)/glutamyl-tRNA(Gln) amidotransferase subunit A